MTAAYVGVDVGTSAVKVAAFDGRGELLEALRRPMPELELHGDAAVQPLEACIEAVNDALRGLTLAEDRRRFVALTTQRDTALLSDAEGRPLTPLISWRDRREQRYGSIWNALAAEPATAVGQARAVRSLTSELSLRWTGRSAETVESLPRHLSGRAAERLDAVCGRTLQRPEMVELGTRVGPLAGGPPLHLTAGDKNCELLGNGVLRPGIAGLSLGSAVSLGVAVQGPRPRAAAGVVVTPAAFAGGWNVETGLPVGMQAERMWKEWLAGELTLEPTLLPGLWCLPFFAGALDRPSTPAALVGLSEQMSARDLFQAWAQGVVGELRRLRPALERAGGHAARQIVMSGGGLAASAWARLIADALRVSVVCRDDPWSGARGAVMAVLLSGDAEAASRFLEWSRTMPETSCEPDPDGADRADRYYATQDQLVQSIGDVFGRHDDR